MNQLNSTLFQYSDSFLKICSIRKYLFLCLEKSAVSRNFPLCERLWVCDTQNKSDKVTKWQIVDSDRAIVQKTTTHKQKRNSTNGNATTIKTKTKPEEIKKKKKTKTTTTYLNVHSLFSCQNLFVCFFDEEKFYFVLISLINLTKKKENRKENNKTKRNFENIKTKKKQKKTRKRVFNFSWSLFSSRKVMINYQFSRIPPIIVIIFYRQQSPIQQFLSTTNYSLKLQSIQIEQLVYLLIKNILKTFIDFT